MTRLSRRAFLAAMAPIASARALGRTPFGGALRLRLPLYFGGLDPHALDDPLSALFASAIADPLYALDENNVPYPALAAALPEATPNGTRVRLRPGLQSARGKPLTSKDIRFSLERARTLGGVAVLGAFSRALADPKDALSILIPNADPVALARALSSPLTAIVPRGFTPLAPDGTGAFLAVGAPGALTLTRNENAARGPAYLDRIDVTRGSDLADALRAFESGAVDVGWLGNGLYRARPGAIAFDGPVYGWFILRTGQVARTWGAPGIARQLAAALPPDALAHFGVRALPPASDSVRWGGGTSTLLVSDDAPQVIELGRALEPLLSSPGNEVTLSAVPRAGWLEARKTRRYALMLDFLRKADSDPTHEAQALLAAADPALATRPPRSPTSLTELTRTLPLGILGEARVQGSRMPTFESLDTWQLGTAWQRS